jgi:hypothetical protein
MPFRWHELQVRAATGTTVDVVRHASTARDKEFLLSLLHIF